MGKREEVKFEKKPRDKYYTIDPSAARGFEWGEITFYEPCAGNGSLVRLLESIGGTCVGASDIAPEAKHISKVDCLELTESDVDLSNVIVTNPPFTWVILKPIMDHLLSLKKPLLLLLPADFMHNVRMGPYMKQCREVVSVGRMYWEPNKVKGVDNFCWYLFDKGHKGFTEFVGR